MSKISRMYESSNESSGRSQNVVRNLTYARYWFKQKTWHPCIKVKAEQAGSSHCGSIAKGVLQLSFQPPFGVNWPNRGYAVSTMDDETTFRAALDEAYDDLTQHAKNMDRLEEEGNLPKSYAERKGLVYKKKGLHVSNFR